MITFAIPAHNEEVLLPRTLAAIHKGAREVGIDYEIVVADDSSTDRTPEMAAENGARVVRIERRQIAAARNAAARAGSGSRLVFVDADTAVSPGTLRGILRAFDGGAAGGGATVDFDGEVPRMSRVLLRVLMAAMAAAGLTGGACMFCRRGVFEATGGFDEGFYASEEIHFARAIRRHGRFVVVREPVITSGRKVRAYSTRELLAIMARLSVSGLRGVRRREGLEIWYGARREDPGCPVRSGSTSRP